MTDDLDPAKPVLVPEFRVRITLASGAVVLLARASKADAEATARAVRHGTVEIECRLSTPWQTVPTRRSAKVAGKRRCTT